MQNYVYLYKFGLLCCHNNNIGFKGLCFIHFLVRPCISYLESTFLVVALNIRRQTGKVCFLSYGVMWSFSIAIVADGSYLRVNAGH